MLIAAAVLLTWYAKLGVNNPFAVVRSIRVYGDGGGCAVAAVAAEFRKDTVVVSKISVSDTSLSALPAADSSGAAVWKEVRPFADSVRAILLTYGRMTALICDTALFAPIRGGSNGVSAQFYEKLDILVVPPLNDEELLGTRNRFRPRFVVAAPPCANAPAKNILCAPAPSGKTGRWRYDFTIKSGKLEVKSNH
ncbi:MAG: hypothetical protein LBC59_02875 [Chitinispirillales bacterium]|nr:hypothetical protein [Chitinispirillales bacterium]